MCADRRAALSLDDPQSISQPIRPRIAQRLPFGFGFGFGFLAVFAAFLKSCADGASLLLGLRGFLPAARRFRMFSYKPGLAMVKHLLHQSDDGYSQQSPGVNRGSVIPHFWTPCGNRSTPKGWAGLNTQQLTPAWVLCQINSSSITRPAPACSWRCLSSIA